MALSPRHPSRVREAKYSGHDRAQGECATVLDKKSEVRLIRMIFNLTWTARSEARHCSTRFLSSITSACMSPITLIRASTVPSPRLLVFLRIHIRKFPLFGALYTPLHGRTRVNKFSFSFSLSQCQSLSVSQQSFLFRVFWIFAMYASRVETPFQ